MRFGDVKQSVVLAGVLAASSAHAQSVATSCEGCVRAEATLGDDAAAMRALLAKLVRDESLDPGEIELLRRHDNHDDLARLACGEENSGCVDNVRTAIDNAVMSNALPTGSFPPTDPGTCDPYVVSIRSPKTGFGAELATGWQDSALPTDHRTWGYGLEARRRLSNRFGLVGRVARTNGRDAGIDSGRDGRDDDGTGSVSRLFALAGPSLTFAARRGQPPWFGRFDLLAGYTAMTSPGSEDGFVAGVDISYQLAVLAVGVRALQGVGDAADARLVVVHIGPAFGAAPTFSFGGGCPGFEPPEQRSRFGYGFDLALSGFGLGTGIGYMPPTVGLETSYALHPRVQPLARADLLVFLHGDKDRILHQSLLGGARFDLATKDNLGNYTGVFVDVLAGYGWAAVTRPSSADSGAVADIGVGYEIDDNDTVIRLRAHARLGLVPDNEDLRAIFLSMGVDLRPTREIWR